MSLPILLFRRPNGFTLGLTLNSASLLQTAHRGSRGAFEFKNASISYGKTANGVTDYTKSPHAVRICRTMDELFPVNNADKK
jgi:hypothetical protein